MIRQYKQFFEKVFLILLCIKFRRDISPNEVLQYAVDEWHPGNPRVDFPQTEKLVRCTRSILEGTQPMKENSWDDMLLEIADQLEVEDQKGPKDGTLIDRLVRTIGLPYARNAMGARILSDLRRALLLPDEMAQLGERLESREMACHMCKHVFMNNEMVTLLKDGHDALMYCTRCHKPGMVACQLCEDHSVAVDKRLSKALEQVFDCGQHGEDKEKKETAPAQPGDGYRFATTMARPPAAAGRIYAGRASTVGGRIIATPRVTFTGIGEDTVVTTNPVRQTAQELWGIGLEGRFNAILDQPVVLAGGTPEVGTAFPPPIAPPLPTWDDDEFERGVDEEPLNFGGPAPIPGRSREEIEEDQRARQQMPGEVYREWVERADRARRARGGR